MSQSRHPTTPVHPLAVRIEQAASALAPHLQHTPMADASSLSERLGLKVWFKLENVQLTGSFKIRGALNKILQLDAQSTDAGIVAASSGNHGMAVAYAAKLKKITATIVVPKVAPAHKIATMRRFGAEVQIHGDDCVQSELYARGLANEKGATYVSPYNDMDVVVGQGTVAVEMMAQAPNLDAVYVAVGGGGLIGGMGAYLSRYPNVDVFACSPDQSPAMERCLAAGSIIDVPCYATLSDATAGGVEPGAVTFELCQEVIDQHVLVSEAEILDALRDVILGEHQLIEGAAAVAVAGCLKTAQERGYKEVGIVLCGANIGKERLQAVVADD